MSDMELENHNKALDYAASKAGYSSLRWYQREILLAFAEGNDCLMCVPTGAGKSVAFECAPFVSHFLDTRGQPDVKPINKLALVISPLVSLMRTQCTDLCERGISAVCLSDAGAPTEETQDEQSIVKLVSTNYNRCNVESIRVSSLITICDTSLKLIHIIHV